MHDSIRLELGQGGLNLIDGSEITFEKVCSRVDRGSMAFGQIIEDGHRVPFIEEQLCADTANIARPADNQDLHRASVARCHAVSMTSLTSSLPVPRSSVESGDSSGAGSTP